MTTPDPQDVPDFPEGPTMRVVTPTVEKFFDTPQAAIEFAAERRITRDSPADIYTLTVDGEWMAVDW